MRTWHDHWEAIVELEEKLEKLSTSHNEPPTLARKSFDGFFITSETLRDAVKRDLGPATSTNVDDEMKASVCLRLAHDVGIRAKHDVQDRQKPWTGCNDIEVIQTEFSMRVETSTQRGSRGAFVPVNGEPSQSFDRPPNRWSYKWQLRCVRSGQADDVIDGLTLARRVVHAWRELLTSLNLTP